MTIPLHAIGVAPNFALDLGDDFLELTGRFNGGIYRVDMATRTGLSTDELFLSIEELRQMDNDPLGELPSAADRTGPWDQATDHMLVPWLEVYLDGRFLGRSWADLPGLEDLPAGRYRFSTGVEVDQPGDHVVRFQIPDLEERMRADDIREVRIGPDERQPETGMERMRSLRREHPRILLTSERLEQMRRPPVGLWGKVVAAVLETAPAPDFGDPSARGFYREIEAASLAAAIKDEPQAVRLAWRRVEALMELPYWGHCPNPHEMGHDNDMAAGLNLYALVIAYDWLFRWLKQPQRDRLREKIYEKARLLYDFSVLQRDYWPVGYAQNHMHAATLGLGTAGLLFMDEDDEARRWAVWVRGLYHRVWESYTADGSAPPLTAGYGMRFIVRYQEALRISTGINLFDHPQFRLLPAYVMANSSSCPPSLQLDLHSLLSREGVLASDYLRQVVDRRIEKASSKELGRRPMLALWYPRGGRSEEHGLPTCQCFHDGGIVTMRSAWLDDGPWMRLECGPPGGHSVFPRINRYDCAHYQPNAGSFVLRVGGEPVVTTPGSTYRKLSKHHNTLTVSGYGQFSDGRVWSTLPPAGGYGRITDFLDDPGFCRVRCELGDAYPEEAGVEELRRHVLFIKPYVFLLVDELTARRPRLLQWWVHHPVEMERGGSRTFRLPAGKIPYQLTVLAPECWNSEQDRTLVVRSYTNRSEVPYELCLEPDEPAESCRFVTMLCPDRGLVDVEMENDSLSLHLHSASKPGEGVSVGPLSVCWNAESPGRET
jgi:hypothetical protein